MKTLETVELPIDRLQEAPWNPNVLDEAGLARLRRSLERFGFVQNLVVRPYGGGYEVLSGNQRLRLLREAGAVTAPCAVVDLDDAQARLLAQALNRIHGEDDLGLRAAVLREVLQTIPEAEVSSLLPETPASLAGWKALGAESLADHLEAWQSARAARLKHLAFQLTAGQLEVVEEALEQVLAGATKTGDNPNQRGNALYLLCRGYLRAERHYTQQYTREASA